MAETSLISDPQALERLLRKVDPRVRFVKERHLRRVINLLDEEAATLPPTLLRPWLFVCEKVRPLDCFPPEIFQDAERTILGLLDPDDSMLHGLSDQQILQHYWGMLFRHAVQEHWLASGEAEAYWHQLPERLRREAEFVLLSDGLIAEATPADMKFARFVAEVSYFQHFNAEVLQFEYPSWGDAKSFFASGNLNSISTELFQRTRPPGALHPQPLQLLEHPEADRVPAGPPATPEQVRKWTARAERMDRLGNRVRAAILLTRAAETGHSGAHQRKRAARLSLEELIPRLATVFGWSGQLQQRWTTALLPLLPPASRGIWPPASKALYELQRIAIDLEKEIYAVDPGGWLSHGFQRPLVRKLDLARVVIRLKHLQKAAKGIAQTPLTPAERQILDDLLHEECRRAEVELRERIGPVLRQIFDEVGLRARHAPETIAREKVIAELLDGICTNGFIRFADLRDAIARNRLKLVDLRNPWEFLSGDPLLRADSRLGQELDGVYRPGEIYLRWIQRGSSLAFGTRTGRWITKFIALPIISAVMTIEFGKYLFKELGHVAHWISAVVKYDDEEFETFEQAVDAAEAAARPAAPISHAIGWETLTGFGVLALIYLGLFHWPQFRRGMFRAASHVGRVFRHAFIEWPLLLWRCRLVRTIRHNWLTRWLHRYFGWAFTVALIVGVILLAFGASQGRVIRGTLWTFTLVALITNTPFGRRFQDETDEFLLDLRRMFLTNFLPGLWSWFVWVFRELLGALDRLLYFVDEWFRFREGQSKPSLALKVVLSLAWFPVAYILRFAFFLLIEPQVNPVKHFPVVTVSHKLLITQIYPLAGPVSKALSVSMESAAGIITAVFTGIPGIFGFIVWELKENWRLYAANRSPHLQPNLLGHHGETMRGLLRPGFHSGTIPKFFRRLRKLIRSAERQNQPLVMAKPLEGLHHIEQAIQSFAERDFLAPLLRDPAWQGEQLECRAVHLAPQAVELQIVRGQDPRAVRFSFEYGNGVIGYRMIDPGFTVDLIGDQKTTWEFARSGFLAMAAVDQSDREPMTWDAWVRVWDLRNSAHPVAGQAA